MFLGETLHSGRATIKNMGFPEKKFIHNNIFFILFNTYEKSILKKGQKKIRIRYWKKLFKVTDTENMEKGNVVVHAECSCAAKDSKNN